jgi:hypothetical protein
MQKDIVDSGIRQLNDVELDAISGGAATAWEGAKAVASVIERTIAVGFGIPVSGVYWAAYGMNQ